MKQVLGGGETTAPTKAWPARSERTEHSHLNHSYSPMSPPGTQQGGCNTELWKHSSSLQAGSGFLGSSVSKNAFPRFSKFRALSKLGKCPSAEEILSPSNVRNPCDIFMAICGCFHQHCTFQSWLQKAEETPLKRQSRAIVQT